MILIICMAGRNTRFHDAGFDTPKYLLPWGDKVILDAILDEMQATTHFERILLLANQRDIYFKKYLLELAERQKIREQDIIFIPDTRGQAHTAAIGAQVAINNGDTDMPIAFHNSDTIISDRDWPSVIQGLREYDAFVDVFPASSAAFCYVALNGNKVARIIEKKVISPFASSGFYGFQSASAYLSAFDALLSDERSQEPREIYISELIQSMLDRGAQVFSNELNRDSATTVLGTPEEYGLELARRAIRR